MKLLKSIRYLLLLLSLAAACKSYKQDADISKIDLEVKIKPFYEELFKADTTDIKALADSFAVRYGKYWELYNEAIINTGDVSKEGFAYYLSNFVRNPNIRELADTCMKVYSDRKSLEDELTKAFKHLKYYYPGKTVPDIYFHISGFNQSVVVDSGLISVSIDNYLGKNTSYYSALMVPVYLRAKMTKQQLVRDVVLAYGITEFGFSAERNYLLNNMMYHGKILYFLKTMMPHLSGAELMAYSEEQYKWCEDNEEMIWDFFVKNKYLFSTDYKLIMKYINDAPFTSGMPKESPGRTAVWLGYRIISSYMDNTDSDIVALMANNDYSEIFRKAVYQP